MKLRSLIRENLTERRYLQVEIRRREKDDTLEFDLHARNSPAVSLKPSVPMNSNASFVLPLDPSASMLSG